MIVWADILAMEETLPTFLGVGASFTVASNTEAVF